MWIEYKENEKINISKLRTISKSRNKDTDLFITCSNGDFESLNFNSKEERDKFYDKVK